MKHQQEKHQPRVLVVDDENTIAETVQVVLELRGYKIYTAENGRTALDLLHRHRPDLAIIDLVLPEVDGLTLIGEMRRNRHLSKIPVIVITVVTQDSDLADGFWRNALETEGFVTKPFDPFKLADKVDAILAAGGIPTPTA
jgi:DNA-binding response OmpR family regulator